MNSIIYIVKSSAPDSSSNFKAFLNKEDAESYLKELKELEVLRDEIVEDEKKLDNKKHEYYAKQKEYLTVCDLDKTNLVDLANMILKLSK
jgi:hypothetical protein